MAPVISETAITVDPKRSMVKAAYDPTFPKPWITTDLLRKCSERDSMLKDILKEHDSVILTELREKYNKMRNEITNEKRRSKKRQMFGEGPDGP